ncbi:MAG: hypothetical protein U0326_39300 [Polyangiales bacterium]
MLIKAQRTVYVLACDACRATTEAVFERSALRALALASGWRVCEDASGRCEALCVTHRGTQPSGWFMALVPRGRNARRAVHA